MTLKSLQGGRQNYSPKVTSAIIVADFPQRFSCSVRELLVLELVFFCPMPESQEC